MADMEEREECDMNHVRKIAGAGIGPVLFVLLMTFCVTACKTPLNDGFTPQTNSSTANDEATLGLVGTKVESSDVAVATAEIKDGKIIAITSVAEGTVTITVSAAEYTATSLVTVGADGAVSIGTIRKGGPSGGFTPQTDSSTANNVITLGLTGTSAVSSNTSVATVTIVDGKIAITSVTAGTADITVSADGSTPATIPVAVMANGTVAIGTIKGCFPVTSITGVPTAGTVGPLTLTGTVAPANTTNQTIGWTVTDAGTTGAILSGNTLSTAAVGTVKVTATITNGRAVGTDYTKKVSITIFDSTLAQYGEMVLATPNAGSPVTITGDNRYGGAFPAGRTVILSPFRIAKYETTYELWYEVKQWATDIARGGNVYTFNEDGQAGAAGTESKPAGTVPAAARLEPVTGLGWRDAVVWCNAYSEMSGKEPVYQYSGSVIRNSTDGTACDGAQMDADASGYRLPTEAQWEYAARGGGTPSTITSFAYKWAGTDTETELGDYAWYDGDSGVATHPVGGKTANALGLYDMTGNVREWCWDWYDTAGTGSETDPAGAASGTERVIQGGGWDFSASFCAVAFRPDTNPNNWNYDIGFRVVMCF
jgi:formylglycine-generating enzyme required for sulfatase activity